MVWPFGSSSNETSSNGDPLRDLDPSLREFLDKESPVRYKLSEAPPPAPQSSKSQQSRELQPPTEKSENAIPAQSLYQDGRYSGIWSTYRPLHEIESETKTDQEKLLDVIDGYKQRRAQIGRAALENCAMEQWALNDCFSGGGLKDRFTMCRAQNKSLERCYVMNARFLKALGYLNSYSRPPEVDEQIQMHADTLYHRMLAQERAAEDAKAAGLPVPTFPPIVSATTTSPTPIQSSTTSQAPYKDSPPPLPAEFADLQVKPSTTIDELKPSVREKLKGRLKGLTPEERELELKAIGAEIAAGELLQRQIGELWDEQAKAKQARKEAGKATFGDTVNSLFGR